MGQEKNSTHKTWSQFPETGDAVNKLTKKGGWETGDYKKRAVDCSTALELPGRPRRTEVYPA
jgi:hypothetical protein